MFCLIDEYENAGNSNHTFWMLPKILFRLANITERWDEISIESIEGIVAGSKSKIILSEKKPQSTLLEFTRAHLSKQNEMANTFILKFQRLNNLSAW